MRSGPSYRKVGRPLLTNPKTIGVVKSDRLFKFLTKKGSISPELAALFAGKGEGVTTRGAVGKVVLALGTLVFTT